MPFTLLTDDVVILYIPIFMFFKIVLYIKEIHRVHYNYNFFCKALLCSEQDTNPNGMTVILT